MAYNSKVVKKVLDDFENKYKSAAASAEKRKTELRANIPGFREIELKLAATYRELAAITVGSGAGFEAKFGDVKKTNAALLKKRKSLLESSGYKENYAEPVYECANCEDTGYIGEAMCACLKKALAEESVKYSGIGRSIKNQTFKNFDLNYYDKKKSTDKLIKESPYIHMREVYEQCKRFAENFGEGYAGNLIFMGAPGLGKTHLSSAVGYELIKKGCDVFYDSAQNILYSYEKERFSRAAFDPEITARYTACDLLIIDDLGTEFTGNMSVSSLFNLINTRLLDKKSMIISTNLTGAEMQAKYEPRIISRIFGEFDVLNFIGDDIRFKKLSE